MGCKAQTTAIAQLWRGFATPQTAQNRDDRAARNLFSVALAVNSLRAAVGRRKTAERHLAEIEQNLAVTLASIEAGFIATDAERRATRMNAVAEQVTGWSQSAAQGQHLLAVFARENQPAAPGQRKPRNFLPEADIAVDQPQLLTVIACGGQGTPL